MCGRFGQTATSAELAAAFEAAWRCAEPDLPRYNIAPTEHAPVLLGDGGRRVLDVFRWGLIPWWAKDPGVGNKMINARAEGVRTSNAFREAFERRRCLVPASGFYEWLKAPGVKVPHWLHAPDGAPLTFAGLWERWRPAKDAEPVYTFTILTTTPSADVAPLHDRMPVIVAAADRELWLDLDLPLEGAAALLRPAPDGALRAHAVSSAVNRAGTDHPSMIVAVDPSRPAAVQSELFAGT